VLVGNSRVGERGNGAVSSPYHYTTWLRVRGRVRGVAFPPLGLDPEPLLR
jgi:hypothetical protein